MSSRTFAIAYACNRPDEMSGDELDTRIAHAERYAEALHRTELTRVHVGDGRTGFVVWYPSKSGSSWPVAVDNQSEGAAWIHIPALAKGPEDGIDPVRSAKGVTDGAIDRVQIGAPGAAIYWNQREGLRLVNDRLGMVRLYQFDFPEFGHVWSTRGGLAHIFCGHEPAVLQSTWSEVAALGWNMSGKAHLGNGEQLRASSTVRSDAHGRTHVASDLDDWITATAYGIVPSDEESAHGMVASMRLVNWWKNRPAADLSGGKDSRVTAAAAINARVVNAVRTVNTDSGEVDTARHLLDLIDNPVEHRVTEAKPPSGPTGGVLSRYLSSQRAWEGAYNAVSAHRGAVFKGFLPVSSPIINGLGGEAIQGHTMATASSREKLAAEGTMAGQEWLNRLITVNMTALDEDHTEAARSVIDGFAEWSRSLGFTSAFQVIDLFYHFSKMPFWSQPQVNPGVLLPFYSPQLLPRAMWSLTNPSLEYGRTHRNLLAYIQPEWANQPFYKGSPKSRSIPWMWENEDWPEFRDYVGEGVSAIESFSTTKVRKVIHDAESGEGRARHEISLARVMWELSFREFAEEIAKLTRESAEASRRVRATRR